MRVPVLHLDGTPLMPFHLHHEGVEIHLGYSPMHGYTVHGDCYAEMDEGYAMPVPKMTRHGYVNESTTVHHVPFVFGSLKHGGCKVSFCALPNHPCIGYRP